ncbi:MAG: GSCFA domain-containing protein [Reichenbachiella sp.]|uniref:GSCFA domain-containing protein n=1 Tax=Reichenbachiella sp. TaxID=2184521 RepID=UPI003266C8D9
MNSNNFRTEYHPKSSSMQIRHESNLLTVGSCFSDNVGQKLLDSKFSVQLNPFGTVYNPISIFDLLLSREVDAEKFVEVGGQYFHLDYHSQFTSRDKGTLKTVLELKKKEITAYLSTADFVFITLGTAFVYERKSTAEVVANCHKLPQKNFTKRLLTIEEMISSFQQLKSYLNTVNPSLQFIFTVSPVRHIKDGIVENQLSKSLLRVLCHELTRDEKIEYFPAYEMMMDDLRDYRFYKNDMIHPTEMAEDYIWNKFQQTYFSDQTQKIVKEWDKVRVALAHRPFNPDSESHQKFISDQLKKLDVFSEYFSITEEKRVFENQLR